MPAARKHAFFASNKASLCVAIAGALLAAALGTEAEAATIDLSYSTTAAGQTGAGVGTILPVPGSYTYGNSLAALSTPVYTTGGGQSFEFYDDYIFSIQGASANSITSSINLDNFLGLNDFEVRLYQLAGNTPLPAFGAPVGGTLVSAWSTPINYSAGMTGLVAVLPDTTLDAGSYVLEVRGNVSGSSGGSYSGVMNLAPVPLPAAVWLLIGGLGGLGFFRRRT